MNDPSNISEVAPDSKCIKTDCPFCNPDPSEIILRNESGFVMADHYPVSPGHLLVIPWRHVPDYFQATEMEILDLHRLIRGGQDVLMEHYSPGGFNIGINIGKIAGQSIFHLHIHLIPRYSGDHPNPRGGVRHLIPGKGNY